MGRTWTETPKQPPAPCPHVNRVWHGDGIAEGGCDTYLCLDCGRIFLVDNVVLEGDVRRAVMERIRQ